MKNLISKSDIFVRSKSESLEPKNLCGGILGILWIIGFLVYVGISISHYDITTPVVSTQETDVTLLPGNFVLENAFYPVVLCSSEAGIDNQTCNVNGTGTFNEFYWTDCSQNTSAYKLTDEAAQSNVILTPTNIPYNPAGSGIFGITTSGYASYYAPNNTCTVVESQYVTQNTPLAPTTCSTHNFSFPLATYSLFDQPFATLLTDNLGGYCNLSGVEVSYSNGTAKQVSRTYNFNGYTSDYTIAIQDYYIESMSQFSSQQTYYREYILTIIVNPAISGMQFFLNPTATIFIVKYNKYWDLISVLGGFWTSIVGIITLVYGLYWGFIHNRICKKKATQIQDIEASSNNAATKKIKNLHQEEPTPINLINEQNNSRNESPEIQLKTKGIELPGMNLR